MPPKKSVAKAPAKAAATAKKAPAATPAKKGMTLVQPSGSAPTPTNPATASPVEPVVAGSKPPTPVVAIPPATEIAETLGAPAAAGRTALAVAVGVAQPESPHGAPCLATLLKLYNTDEPVVTQAAPEESDEKPVEDSPKEPSNQASAPTAMAEIDTVEKPEEPEARVSVVEPSIVDERKTPDGDDSSTPKRTKSEVARRISAEGVSKAAIEEATAEVEAEKMDEETSSNASDAKAPVDEAAAKPEAESSLRRGDTASPTELQKRVQDKDDSAIEEPSSAAPPNEANKVLHTPPDQQISAQHQGNSAVQSQEATPTPSKDHNHNSTRRSSIISEANSSTAKLNVTGGARSSSTHGHSQPHATSPLHAVFLAFASFGAAGQTVMDGSKFAKLCKDCKLVDKDKFTTIDVDLTFNKTVKKGERKISWEQFRDTALPIIAEKKKVAVDVVHEKIIETGGPQVKATKTLEVDEKGALIHRKKSPSATPPPESLDASMSNLNATTSSLQPQLVLDQGLEGALKAVFLAFAQFGDAKATAMDGTKFAKLCKESQLVDEVFSIIDVDITFNKTVKKGERRITFEQFRDQALVLMAKRRKEEPESVARLLDHGTARR